MLVALAAVLATQQFVAAPANATTTHLCRGYDTCADQGRSHYGYKTSKVNSYWRMDAGNNCTNYVAFRFVTRKYDKLFNTRPWSGDGTPAQYGRLNRSETNSTPAVGLWPGLQAPSTLGTASPGHVSYVEKVVSSSEVWVSSTDVCGSVSVA